MKRFVKGAAYNVRATAYTEGVLQKSQGTVYIPGGLHCGRTLYTVRYLMYQWGTVYGVTRWCM